MNLREIAKESHRIAVKKGWYENSERNTFEVIAMIHSELSEACEAFRNGNPPSEKIPGHSHASEEFADCIIRIVDTCEALGFDIEGAVLAKMKYNENRRHRHGGKLA